MEPATRLIFEQLGISLLLGLLVGLQRQRSETLLAGVRTFPLITVLGTLAAALDQAQPGGWIVPAGLLALVIVVGVNNSYQLRRRHPDLGLTTEAAILLMYLVGAYVVFGDRVVAIAVGTGVAVLLQFKPELHHLVARLGTEDVRAIMTFALITGIILPVLPNQTYDLVAPLNILNPFAIWLMVVLMVGISLGGYLIYKFLGSTAGILLGGLLGGAISSTATTFSYARRSSQEANHSLASALVIFLASTVVYARVMLEISVVAANHFRVLAAPIAIIMLASVLAAVVVWWRTRDTSTSMPEQQNPTEFTSALVFAGLYAGVSLALSAANTYLGGESVYAVAVLSGLTDMDAITLSSARLVQLGPESGGLEPEVGWRLIVVATLANLGFKWGICWMIGQPQLAKTVGVMFAIPAVVGSLLLIAWPY